MPSRYVALKCRHKIDGRIKAIEMILTIDTVRGSVYRIFLSIWFNNGAVNVSCAASIFP
jgi:hypothetical protein